MRLLTEGFLVRVQAGEPTPTSGNAGDTRVGQDPGPVPARDSAREPCACRRWALRWLASAAGNWQRARLTVMAGLVLLALCAAAMSFIHSATALGPPASDPATPRVTPAAGEVLPAAEHGDAGPLLAEYDCEDAGAWKFKRPGAIPDTAILTYPNVYEPKAVPFPVAEVVAKSGLADETLYLCGAR